MEIEKVKQYLIDHQDLLKKSTLDEFYKVLIDDSVNNSSIVASFVGKVTEFIIGAGVDPLQNLESTEVPELYLGASSNIKNISIPEGFKSIGSMAFSNSGIESITFPNSLEKIGNFACNECQSLTRVYFGNGIRDIGTAAFEGCQSIERVSIPNISGWCTVDTGIHSSPFHNYADLYNGEERITNLVIPASAHYIRAHAFKQCRSLQQVKVEEGIVEIGIEAFAKCYGLRELHLPNSLNKLSTNVIAFDESIEKVVYNGTLEEWKHLAYGWHNYNGGRHDFIIQCTDGTKKWYIG